MCFVYVLIHLTETRNNVRALPTDMSMTDAAFDVVAAFDFLD
jgi:hypothetical protein